MEIEGDVLTEVTNSDIPDGTFIIPEGIKYIGKLAFLNCTNLKKLEIPEGVEAIGEYAFRFCISLKTVKIPSTVKYIRKNSFSIGSMFGMSGVRLSKIIVTPDREIDEKFKSYFPPKVTFVVKDKDDSNQKSSPTKENKNGRNL